MPTTPGLGLPYPSGTVAPNVPADMQALAQAVEGAIYQRPRVKIITGADQALTSGSLTTVDFNGGSVAYDTNAMADIANDRIVIKTAGLYRFSARLAWGISSAGYRALIITRGVSEFLVDNYDAATPSQSKITTVTSEPILCAVNDAISLQTVQTSGGSLNLIQANSRRCHLAADWAGKA